MRPFGKAVLISCAVLACCLARAAAASAERPAEHLRIASVQMTISDDLATNLDRIRKGVADAAARHARVAVFPETALSGFNQDTIAHLDWGALKSAMAEVAGLAKANNIYILYGTATRSPFERPYNSAVLVGPDGAEVMRYYKMAPESWFEPGEHPALFEIDGIKCTAIVCHDNRFPERVRLPVLAGARICFYISYEINGAEASRRKKDGYRAQLVARAVENNVWVVQANGVGPIGAPSLSLGCSHIVQPDGVVLAEAHELAEDLLVADIDPAQATAENATQSLNDKFFGGWWKQQRDELDAMQTADATTPATEKPRHALRLALMQEVPVKWDLDANFKTFLARLDDARGADVFITPECWLDGYAAADKASSPERLTRIAQALDTSPYLKQVADEARKRAMYICFGFTSLEDGKIYDAAGLWDKSGQLAGMYRKTHLQTHDLQFSPGMALPVWKTDFGTVGTMICADRRWPETARTLRVEGAHLILNPSYGMHGLDNEMWMRTRGYENQCFIAFAHPQTSFVVGPKGGIVAKREGVPGVLLCDIDLRESRDDDHIKDRRPDIYRLDAGDAP